MAMVRLAWLGAVVVLASGCATLTAGGSGRQQLALTTAPAQDLAPSQVDTPFQPAEPVALATPRPSLTPAPRPARAASLMLELGSASACDESWMGFGAVLTVPVGGPFVVGGEVFHGEAIDPFGGKTQGGGVYGLLGGVETVGERARAALLLRLAIGSADTGRSTTFALPQAALRAEVSLVAADTLLLGLWGTAGMELGERTFTNPTGDSYRIGGKVFGAGVNIGFAFKRGGLAARSPSDPAELD